MRSICDCDFEDKIVLNLDRSVPENEQIIVVQYLSMLLKNQIPPTRTMVLNDVDHSLKLTEHCGFFLALGC